MNKHFNHKDGDIVIIKGISYDVTNNTLFASRESDDIIPAVICPKCHNDKFSIKYGSYECIAVCQCGNEMSIYSG